MKPVMYLLLSAIMFISCTTDYDGDKPAQESSTSIIYESENTLVTSAVRIEWSAIIGNETGLDYFYCVTTDTSITEATALSSLTEAKWIKTSATSGAISFPMVPYNSDIIFYRDSVYTDPDSNQVNIKIAYSKLFVYAQNSIRTRSPVEEKLFSRINQKPRLTKLESIELDVESETETGYAYEEKLILPVTAENSVPLDFSWTGEDADLNSRLQYKWELAEIQDKGSVIVESSEWSSDLNTMFADEIYSNNPQGDYSFKVYIRDDALEQGEKTFTVYFSVLSPTFEKGILLIDDTDSTLTESSSYLYYEGNPIASDVRAMYKSFLEDAGFTENNTDPLKDYDIVKFKVETELVRIDTTFAVNGTDTSWVYTDVYINYYFPDLELMSKYRMVLIASEDRSNENGIDFSGTEDNLGYSDHLGKYLDAGGKTFIIGHCALMKKIPYRLEANKYLQPLRQIFDPHAEMVTEVADITLDFFHDYFGIYAMTFPETKTYFSQDIWDVRPSSVPVDYYLQDNYDFIGITKYDNITDITASGIKVDSVNVNKSWRDFSWQIGPILFLIPLSLKDNGTVLTGIPTIEAFKGEPVYKYKSVYDLPVVGGDPDTVYDTDANGTVYHSLKYIDPVLTDGDNSGDITRKTGSVATRYIADGDQYRTAFFAFPLFYMNNTNGEVSDMFNAMIDWFDLEKDPTVSWKK